MFHALDRTELVVVDCRAASTDVFLRYFKTIDLPSVLGLLEARLTLLMPVNHEADSLDQIQRVVEEVSDKASYVVIRNHVHGDSFTLYDRSAVRVRILKKLGGKEITMTRMEEWLVEGLNRENLTVTAAARHILKVPPSGGWKAARTRTLESVRYIAQPFQAAGWRVSRYARRGRGAS